MGGLKRGPIVLVGATVDPACNDALSITGVDSFTELVVAACDRITDGAIQERLVVNSVVRVCSAG